MKTVKLNNLQNGDSFLIPGLEQLKKNMTLISLNDSGATVKGLERDNFEDSWKPFQYRISSTTEVYRCAGERNEPKIETIQQAKPAEKFEPSARGRKKLDFVLALPKTVEFTVNDIKDLNQEVAGHNVLNRLGELEKQGKIKVVKTIPGGRGRPQRVFAFAD